MKYILTVFLYCVLYACLGFTVAFFGRLGWNSCGEDRKAKLPDWQGLRDKLPAKGAKTDGRTVAGNGSASKTAAAEQVGAATV